MEKPTFSNDKMLVFYAYIHYIITMYICKIKSYLVIIYLNLNYFHIYKIPSYAGLLEFSTKCKTLIYQD